MELYTIENGVMKSTREDWHRFRTWLKYVAIASIGAVVLILCRALAIIVEG